MVYQITRASPAIGGGLIEREHVVLKFLKWLPAGPTEDGQGHREHDIIQFISRHGGKRTVRASDLQVVR